MTTLIREPGVDATVPIRPAARMIAGVKVFGRGEIEVKALN
jgi:hypothetical protein